MTAICHETTAARGRTATTRPSAQRAAPSSRGLRRHLAAMACSSVLVVALPAPASAAPWTPTDDATVIETLPTRWGSAEERRAQRAAQARWQARPQALGPALEQARAALARARHHGDPRELGVAEAALAPWWNEPDAPPEVRLLHATVLQSRHQFDDAAQRLDALRLDTAVPLAVRAQAELTHASVLQVQGRYDLARDGCERLADGRYAALGAEPARYGQQCLWELRSLTGEADAAARHLDAMSLQAGETAQWLTLMRAELAERRGEPTAGDLYRQALGDSPDAYTLAAYADWLLAHQHARAVVDLLRDHTQADTLLLRLAIAWRQLGDPAANDARDQLQERFDAARLRGDRSQGREAARFALDVLDTPRQALALARENWTHQKEPADALLLWRAARAAGDTATLDAMRRWAVGEGQPGQAGQRWKDARWAGAGWPGSAAYVATAHGTARADRAMDAGFGGTRS